MKFVFLIPFFFSISIVSFGQELPAAINSKFTGEGVVFHKGKRQKISPDQLFYEGDSIVIYKASLHLLLRGDKRYSILRPGKYKIANILDVAGANQPGLVGQYFKDAIHHTLSGKHDGGFSGSKIGATYGGIVNTRGGCDLLINPWNNLHTDTAVIGFKWKKVDGSNGYKFKITEFSISKELVYQVEVNDTSYIFHTTNFNWVDKQQYLWTVEPIDAEGESCFNSFALYTPESAKEEMEKNIKNINNDKGDLIYQLEIFDTLFQKGWYYNLNLFLEN